MKKSIAIMASLIISPISFSMADSQTVEKLVQAYATEGVITADAAQGKRLWNKTFKAKGNPVERSCASCHTKDLSAPGKHVKTHKVIKPMAPSANPERLTDVRKIEKWFKRNCKWTLGRECSAQEKTDLLLYINNPTNF